MIDARVFEEDRPPERLAFAHGLWFMLLGGRGFAEPERVIRVTDAFPALEGPLRAGEGVWERDGDGYRRVDETTGDWPQFLDGRGRAVRGDAGGREMTRPPAPATTPPSR